MKIKFLTLTLFMLFSTAVFASEGYEMDDYRCPCGAYKEQCEPHPQTCDVSDQMFCSEVCDDEM